MCRGGLVLVAAACLGLGAAGGAAWLFPPQDPPVVELPGEATRVLGVLGPEGRDEVVVEARRPVRLELTLWVPRREELEDLEPRLFVTGPGLRREIPTLAAPVAVGDPLTQTPYRSYSGTGPLAPSVRLPRAGRYRLTVAAAGPGPYALLFPGPRRTSPLELVAFPLDWLRVRLWWFS